MFVITGIPEISKQKVYVAVGESGYFWVERLKDALTFNTIKHAEQCLSSESFTEVTKTHMPKILKDLGNCYNLKIEQIITIPVKYIFF